MAKTLLVGGAVRDQLITPDAPPKDKDYVVIGATAEDMISQGFKQVGKDFPVFLHPETGEEHALARTERKVGTGYTGFDFFTSPDVTLEEDLMRRDLTMNAVAYDSERDVYIDPFGGTNDINNGIIRHVSSSYVEDPLRVLRTARFLARFHHLGFVVADETLELMRTIADSGELECLTSERVWNEIKSALTTESPHKFFECLREVGALSVVLPELDALWGIPQPEERHPEVDCGAHSLLSLQAARKISSNLPMLYGTLLHDLGKATTCKELLPRHFGHEERGVLLVANVNTRLKVPSVCAEFAILICREHLNIHRCIEMKSSTLLKLLARLDSNRKPERLSLLCEAAKADAQGRLGYENRDYPQAAYLKGSAKALKNVDLKLFDFKTSRGKHDAHKAKLDALEAHKSSYLKENEG